MRVLIVEDDPVACRQMQAALERGGHDVVLANDGEHAWQVLESATPPRLVVLDWDLPALDGIAIIGRLRALPKRPYTYVLLVTARGLKADVLAGLDAGADDYLVKPVDMAVLRARVRAGERIVDLEASFERRLAQLQAELERRRDAA